MLVGLNGYLMHLVSFRGELRLPHAGLPHLVLPGARWVDRLGLALGLVVPSWPGARLLSSALAPRVGLVLAADEPFAGFHVVSRCEPSPGESPPTRWRPVLLGPGGWTVGTRARHARALRGLAVGASVHVQRHGCTFRRVEGAVRCVDLDGLVLVLPDSDETTVELQTTSGERARARIADDETLLSLEAHDTLFAAVRDPATGLFERLEASVARAHPSALATVVRDDHRLIRRWSRGAGDECSADYDGAGRLVRLASSDGQELRLEYALATGDRLSGFSHSSLGAWSLASTGADQWVAASALGAVWAYAFAGDGAMVREMRPDAGVSTVERDETNGAATVLRGARTLEYFYDIDGFAICADDAAGPRYELEHDAEGRLTKAVVPGLGQLRRVFDVEGRLAATYDAGEAREVRFGAGEVTVSGPRGEARLTLRAGRVASATIGACTWSLAADDPSHRWLVGSEGQHVYFGGASKGMERWGVPDAFDAVVQRDLFGRIVAYSCGDEARKAERDARGALRAIVPGCAISSDAGGRAIRVTHGAWTEERRYALDGRLASLTRNGSLVRQDTPLEGGALVRSFSVDLGAVEVRHDALGSITRIAIPAPDPSSAPGPEAPAPERLFEHDARGRIRSARIGGRVLTLDRVEGRVVRETWEGAEVRSARDERGARIGLRTSQGLGQAFERDPEGRIAKMTCEWADQSCVVELRHDGAGREIERRIGAFTMTLTRDALGRVVRRTVAFDGRTRDTTEYAWSGSRLRSMAGEWARGSFEHDPASGALAAWSDARGERHALLRSGVLGHAQDGVRYDERGLAVAAASGAYRHSAGAHLRSVRSAAGTQVFAFDPLGGLLRSRAPDVEIDYVRDPLGRLTAREARRFVRHRGEPGSFDRLEVRELVDESRMTLVWDGPRVVHRSEGKGASFTHVWADGLLVLTLVGADAYVVVPGPFGDPEALLSSSGELLWSRAPETLIFGTPDPAAESYGVPAFPDHYFDSQDRLWHSLFRAFDPGTGRYLSPSPLGLAAGPWLHGAPLDPIRERMRFGIGRPREPFWSELAADTFDARWASLVLEQLGSPHDERGLAAWRPLDDEVAPDPGRWLLERAGLA